MTEKEVRKRLKSILDKHKDLVRIIAGAKERIWRTKEVKDGVHRQSR